MYQANTGAYCGHGVKADGNAMYLITGSEETDAYQAVHQMARQIIDIKFMVDTVCGLKQDGTLVFTRKKATKSD